ncbi:MAG: HlyD family efflux transporter periplasmic adaptor subunit [Pirellulales bacterium]
MATQPIDPSTVDQTKQQIRNLVGEVAQLAKSDIEPAEFYDALLHRIVSALAAVGGAVWTVEPGGNLKLAYQINLKQTGILSDSQLADRHGQVLGQMLTKSEGQLVAAGAGDENAGGNPTDYLLIFGPLVCDRETVGLVEVFQRSERGLAAQRGYLLFVSQMCELASGYLQKQQLRQFENRQSLWSQLEQFTRAVHESLRPELTAATICNDGRRLIECDRVSVAIRRGRKCQVTAISGQDIVEKRSNITKKLSQLAATVVETREEVWFHGETADLAPQVEQAIHDYVDESHSKSIGILPLFRVDEQHDEEAHRPRAVIGALIIEQIERRPVTDSMLHRVGVVRDHSAIALTNALEHNDLFLMPLWRALGKTRWLVEARTLPKTVLATAGVLIALLALVLVPAPLEMESKGALQPTDRRDVFAPYGGVVTRVDVRHGELVEVNASLAQLRDPKLDYELTDVTGRMEETREQIKKLRVDLIHSGRLRDDEKDRIAGEILQLEATLASLLRQHDLLEQKRAGLTVRSPIHGQIITWDVAKRLERRTVEQGQVLLMVADVSGPWEIELYMPESKLGPVTEALAAARAEQQPLSVKFILATAPETTYKGTVVEVDAQTEVRGDHGNTVRVLVEIDKDQFAKNTELRPGATVTARVDCGLHPIGYVWFRDLMAFVRTKILFKL